MFIGKKEFNELKVLYSSCPFCKTFYFITADIFKEREFHEDVKFVYFCVCAHDSHTFEYNKVTSFTDFAFCYLKEHTWSLCL